MTEPEEREGYEKAWYRQMLRKVMTLCEQAKGEEIVMDGELWKVECEHVVSVGNGELTEYINLPRIFDIWYKDQVAGPPRQLLSELEGAIKAREPETLLTLREWIRSDACGSWNPRWQRQWLSWLEKTEQKEKEEEDMLAARAEELSKKRRERQEMLDGMQNAQLKQVATAQNRDGTWQSVAPLVDECLSRVSPARQSHGQRRSQKA